MILDFRKKKITIQKYMKMCYFCLAFASVIAKSLLSELKTVGEYESR